MADDASFLVAAARGENEASVYSMVRLASVGMLSSGAELAVDFKMKLLMAKTKLPSE